MKGALSAIGSGILFLVAHLPCCGSTVLIVFGFSIGGTGWVAELHQYRSLILVSSVISLVLGFFLAYRPLKSCTGQACQHQRAKQRITRGMIWGIALLTIPLTVRALAAEKDGHSERKVHVHASHKNEEASTD